MTPQQNADRLLTLWQMGRAAGVPANDRLPVPTPADEFERDLEVIRQVLNRGNQNA